MRAAVDALAVHRGGPRSRPRSRTGRAAGTGPDSPATAGLTQHELARRAGLDVRTVRNAELGNYRPSRITKGKLDAVLSSDLKPA